VDRAKGDLQGSIGKRNETDGRNVTERTAIGERREKAPKKNRGAYTRAEYLAFQKAGKGRGVLGNAEKDRKTPPGGETVRKEKT